MSKLKARIKATGEIIKVVDYNSGSELVELLFPASNGDRILNSWDVVFLDEEEYKPIDWEQRKYEIAKEVMVAFFTNPNKEVWNMAGDAQAKLATIVANNLIEKLKGGEQ
jgi:hypothetical protein